MDDEYEEGMIRHGIEMNERDSNLIKYKIHVANLEKDTNE